MASTTQSTNSSSSATKPTTLPVGVSGSEFSQEQWLDLLKVLSASSRRNLQLALKQYLTEVEKSEAQIAQNLPLLQPRKTPLPDASTLVPSGNHVSQDTMPQNCYGTDRYMALLKQSLDLDTKPPQAPARSSIAAIQIDPPNGLDTLAAAALANTNSETNVTSSSAITVLQGKPVPGTGMVAIPITAQMAPALIGGFKQDPNQRQSPTIRETPKRLAATRAEAEQAAAALALSPPSGGVRYTGGAVAAAAAAKRSRMAAETDDVDNAVGNLLLSANGAAGGLGVTTVKPDPESVNPSAYQFIPGQQDPNGGWSTTQPPSSNNSTTDSSRRRAKDEGINDDEIARREKRRERNRVAAAKCRQNRQNQIEDLKARRKVLEDEGNQTRQVLQNLLHEKVQLEDLLKKHAHNGCPTAPQYFQNGTLLLRLPAPSASQGAATSSIRIIQPTVSAAPNAPVASSSPPVIKPEAPSSTPFVASNPPAQRPNTLSLVTPTKFDSLDSATSLAAQLWSPSIAAKIKTPGGESWVNSQIGLPPTSEIKTENTTAAATAILSTPDLLHQLGISLGGGAGTPTKPIQITVANSGPAVDPDAKSTTAS